MDLKSEFVAAWTAGRDHNALLELVHRHEAAGLSACDAYKTLQGRDPGVPRRP